MEENAEVGLEREIEREFTRRELLHDAIALAKVGVAAVVFNAAGLSAVEAQSDPAQELERYRGTLFGGLWKKGALDKLTYDIYAKGTGEYWPAVTRAVNFLNGENSHLYSRVYGTLADNVWRADRKRVLVCFLRAITIPERESHEKMRNILRKDGILNFVWHKQRLNDALDGAIPRYAAASEAEKKALYMFGIRIQDAPLAAAALRDAYILTIPSDDPDYHKEMDKKVADTKEKAFGAYDKAVNALEAQKAGDYPKMYQQGRQALKELKGIFDEMNGMARRSIEFAKREMDAPDYEKIQVDGNWLRVYRSIRIEWEGLNFDGWIADVKKKVEGAMSGK